LNESPRIFKTILGSIIIIAIWLPREEEEEERDACFLVFEGYDLRF